jgi:hypothetical protein
MGTLRIVSLIVLSVFMQSTYGQLEPPPGPKFMLKVATDPLYVFWQLNHFEAGYEICLGSHWTYGGSAGIIYKSPFAGYSRFRSGYFATQQLRRYKPGRNWFIGLELGAGTGRKQDDFVFNGTSGEYAKTADIRRDWTSLGFFTGFEKQLFDSRWYIDVFAGIGYAVRNQQYLNLTDDEMSLLESDPFLSDDDYYEGIKFLPVAIAGVKVGWVVKQ